MRTYTPMGIIREVTGTCNTTHPAVVEFKGRLLFFSHNGTLPKGMGYSRNVIAEDLTYNPDGTTRRNHPSSEGVTPF